MKTKVDRKKIVKTIKDEAEADKRGRVTVYLNLGLWADFQKACEKDEIAASTALEKLMESYLGR